MSDPAKSPEEIEDVLESVRRLVSDHGSHRVSAVPAPTEATQATPPRVGDALVLAPSLRVSDPDDPWVPVAVPKSTSSDALTLVVTPEAADDAGAPNSGPEQEMDSESDVLVADVMVEEPAPDVANWHPDDRLASFDKVGNVTESEVSNERADGASDDPSMHDLGDLIGLDGAEPLTAEFESETGDDDWPETGAETALLTLVAKREPVRDVRETAEDDNDLPDPAGGEGDLARQEDAAFAVSEDAEQDGAFEALEEIHDNSSADIAEMTAENAEFDDDARNDSHDHPEDAALEGPVQATVSEMPDGRLTDTPIDDFGDATSPFSFPEVDEGIIDEDTLRAMIVEVVREELQGVLGQRITRNVRKMVRREIRLALAVEELE